MRSAKTGITKQLKSYAETHEQEELEALTKLVYDKLHQIARHYMKKNFNNKTLQATALVNEAFIRIFQGEPPTWENRAHFYNYASQTMRHILVDEARKRQAQKRGAEPKRVTLNEAVQFATNADAAVDVLELDTALKKLALLDERQFRIVELRYFGGLDIEETARTLDCSTGTVKREWAKARTWLKKEIAEKE